MERVRLAASVFFRILTGQELPLSRMRVAGLLPAPPLPILGRSWAPAFAPATLAPAPAAPTTVAPPIAATAPVAPAPVPPTHPPQGKHGKKGKKGQSERMQAPPRGQSDRLPTPAPVAPAPVAPAPVALAPVAPAPVALAPAPAAVAPPVTVVVRDLEAEQKARDEGALLFLAALQREGRLLDFLMEKIDAYSDEQVGAAVRGIHSGCSKAIGTTLVVEPVLKGSEESPVTLETGYDTQAIRLTGNVRGNPPFRGTLKHHGWKARPTKPLAAVNGSNPAVVMPAEVEL